MLVKYMYVYKVQVQVLSTLSTVLSAKLTQSIQCGIQKYSWSRKMTPIRIHIYCMYMNKILFKKQKLEDISSFFTTASVTV